MKKILLGTVILLLVFLAGCLDKPTPEERLAEYVSHWNKGDFAVMYDRYLTAKTKKAFPEDDFVTRQENLSEDLGIGNLEVTYEKPGEDAKWDKDQPAEFNIRVKMETLAGPVEFDKPIRLRHEEWENEKNWFVEWDPSYIFPDLEPGDEIGVSRTEAKRGEIVDRAGIPIAKNGTGYQVGIVPEKLDETRKADIAQLLGTTPEAIDTSLNAAWVKPDLFVPIGKTAKGNPARLEQLLEIPGVAAREIGMREYPYGPALAHLTGYIGSISAEQLEKLKEEGYTETDQIGRRGLESLLEDRLRGTDGMKITIKKAQEGLEPVTVAERAAEDGETVKLTIDAELQKVTYDSMKGEPGTAASVDPETGEVLALVSSPAYDPNEFITGMSGARYRELEEDEKTPLFNRFAQSYAPGSTIKPITAAIGIKAGTLDPAEGLTITGKTWQKDASWGSYRVSRVHPEAPNPIDLNRAMVYSDNIYFAQQALAMGKDTLVEGLKQFGFGEPIPLEAMELKASQVSNNGTIGSEGQLADTSFGQGQMLTNILHLASIYQPILTGGTMHKPTLLFDEEDGQVWKEGLIDPAHAEMIRSTLRNVVLDGFAQSANLADVPIAGKTGTAELKAAGEDRGKENGYFVSYPAEQPSFILAMMVENIEDNGGSDYVAAMAAEVHRYASGR